MRFFVPLDPSVTKEEAEPATPEWDQVLAQVEESFERQSSSIAQPTYTPAYLPVLDRRSARLSPTPDSADVIVADEEEEEVEEELEEEEEIIEPEVDEPLAEMEIVAAESIQTQQQTPSSSADWEKESQTTEEGSSSVVTCIEQSSDGWEGDESTQQAEEADQTVVDSVEEPADEADWERRSDNEADAFIAEECTSNGPSGAVADWLRESHPEESSFIPSSVLDDSAQEQEPSIDEDQVSRPSFDDQRVPEQIEDIQPEALDSNEELIQSDDAQISDDGSLKAEESIQQLEEEVIQPLEDRLAVHSIEEDGPSVEQDAVDPIGSSFDGRPSIDDEIQPQGSIEDEKEPIIQYPDDEPVEDHAIQQSVEELLQTVAEEEPESPVQQPGIKEGFPSFMEQVQQLKEDDEIIQDEEQQSIQPPSAVHLEQADECDTEPIQRSDSEEMHPRHGSEERKMTVMGFDSTAAMENLGKMPPELLPRVAESRPSPSRSSEFHVDPDQVTSVFLDTTIPPESHLVVSEAECSAEAVPAEQLDLDAAEYESNPVVLSGKMVLSVIGMDLPVEEPEASASVHHHHDAVPRVTFPPEPFDKKIFLIPSTEEDEEDYDLAVPSSPMEDSGNSSKPEEEDEQGDDSAVPYRPPTPPLKHSRDEPEPPVDPNETQFLTYDQLEEAGEAEAVEEDDQPSFGGCSRVVEEALGSMVESILSESIQQLHHPQQNDREQMSPEVGGPPSSDMAACLSDVQYEVLGSGSSSLDAAELQEEDFERNRDEPDVMEHALERALNIPPPPEEEEEEEEVMEEEPVISDFTIREDYPDEDDGGILPLSEEEIQRARHEIEEIKKLLAEVSSGRILHQAADELQSTARNVISELSHVRRRWTAACGCCIIPF